MADWCCVLIVVDRKLVGDAKTPLDVDLRLFYEAKQVVATTPTLVIADTNKSSLTTVYVPSVQSSSFISSFLWWGKPGLTCPPLARMLWMHTERCPISTWRN